jgi:cell division protein FtsN
VEAAAPVTVAKNETTTEEKLYYNIVVGSFDNRADAEAALAKIRQGIGDAFIKTTIGRHRSYNVVVGVYGVKANADKALGEIRKKAPEAFIKRTVKRS